MITNNGIEKDICGEGGFLEVDMNWFLLYKEKNHIVFVKKVLISYTFYSELAFFVILSCIDIKFCTL